MAILMTPAQGSTLYLYSVMTLHKRIHAVDKQDGSDWAWSFASLSAIEIPAVYHRMFICDSNCSWI